MFLSMGLDGRFKSLSVRRAWIEIRMALFPAPPTMVALRKESVDRNNVAKCKKTIKQVALRKESVDRNIWPVAYDATGHAVALRKESVDRNEYHSISICQKISRSP